MNVKLTQPWLLNVCRLLFSDNNDNDNVLTMLVHVSHAWLGGGGWFSMVTSPSSSLMQTWWLQLCGDWSPHWITPHYTTQRVPWRHYYCQQKSCDTVQRVTWLSCGSCHLSHLNIMIQFSFSHPVDPFNNWVELGTGKSAAYYLVFGWCLFLITCLDSRQITWITLLTKLVN